jgi:large subunit ribosomal protein L15
MTMISLNTLKPAPGSKKNTKRLGRGQGSGQGCTAGKGNKGDGSRSGRKQKTYFEGGQTPMTRRIPKRGFHNPFSCEYQIVNIGELENADIQDKEIDTVWLYNNGYIHSCGSPVKILGNGDFSKKLTIRADAFSKSAREKIEKAKGKAEVITSA